MSKEQLRIYYLFSPFLRIFHWIMVLSILVLFITGLYITKPISGGNPGIEPTFADLRLSLDLIRNIHFVTAFIFVASFILRIYGFVINKGDRLFPKVWKREFVEQSLEVQNHYLFLRSAHRPFLRNPMARMSYVGVYVLIAIEIVSGFAMYGMVNPNGWCAAVFGWTNVLAGHEFLMHLIHHYTAWLIVLFAITHIYMAVRADFMEGEGEISSMFSGVKILKHEPADIGDIMEAKEIAAQRQAQTGGTYHV